MVQLSTFVGAAALASSVLAAPTKYQYYQYEQVAPEELVEEEHVPVYEEKIVAPHVTTTEHVAPQYKYNYHTTTALAAEETYVYEQEQEAVYEPIHEVVYEPEHDTTTLLEQEFEETTYEYVPEHTPEYIPEHVVEETTLLPEETHVAEKTWSSDYAYPTYGSGHSEWGAGYDDCVSQCVAKYGAPKEKYTPVVKPDEVHKGNGVIHTVMVAPEKGVLRYFPFALNATVGDTVRYVWTTPANHTATLSSELALCNRSALAESRDFVSGIRNGVEGESVFDVVVQTEEPQFFYCSVQQHCEKGMWGVINPKSEFGGVNTVGSKWSEWMESNPDLKAAWSYVHETSRTKPEVDDWANNINLDNIPEAAYEDLAANIVWNRAMYDANPGVLENGKGAETPDGSPLTLVEDLSILLSATNQDPAAVNQPAGTPTGALPDPSEVAEELAATSGASKNVAGLSVATILAVLSWMLF